jgi:hypothetical protein
MLILASELTLCQQKNVSWPSHHCGPWNLNSCSTEEIREVGNAIHAESLKSAKLRGIAKAMRKRAALGAKLVDLLKQRISMDLKLLSREKWEKSSQNGTIWIKLGMFYRRKLRFSQQIWVLNN